MTSTPTPAEQIDDFHNEFCGVNRGLLVLEETSCTCGLSKLLIRERLDERKIVALNNYDGKTFSTETNWGEVAYGFIEENNNRIATLEQQLNEES